MCFQPPSLLIGKVWVPVMHFCACPMHCKLHCSGQEARIVQVDFSAACDRVNHKCILYIGLAVWVLEVLCCGY